MPFTLELKEILQNLATGPVLEVGTSTGKFLPFLEKSLYVGIDLSDNSLKLAAKKSRAALLVCADAHHLPFRDDTFDNVICSRSVKFFHSVQTALSEMTRVSRKGSRLMITTDYAKSSIWYRLMVPMVYRKTPYETHWSLEEFSGIANADPEGKTMSLLSSKYFLALPPFLYEHSPRQVWPVLRTIDKVLVPYLKGWFFVVILGVS